MNRRTVTIAGVLCAVLLAGSMLTLAQVENARGPEASLEEILYLPSSTAVKRLSLGYSGLLADVYWTRAVQYFGNKRMQHSRRYDLLDPLLNITTDLDPQLIIAYDDGAIFLAEPTPAGAGQPDKAVALLEKGLRNNPEYWRMYFTMGFIHYLERHDYKAAEQAFQRGSEVPGALPWMKVMAARMAENAADRGTAIALWEAVYETNTEKMIRETAMSHILSLQADAGIEKLEQSVQAYRARTGRLPVNWMEMVRAGFLPGIPQDPAGDTYQLLPDGTVHVEKPEQFPFLGQAGGNQK